MKRLRLVVCTLLFVVSIFGALSTSHVFAEPAALPPNPTLTADTQPNATPQSTPKPATESGSCSLWKNFSLFNCLNEGISWIIKNTLLQIAAFLLWVTANMLNYSIQIGVLGFAKWAPDQIYPIWLIVRQIVSLVIVFIGLYLGFMYILGKDDKFQRYIPWVIMFALFVNFSYPITRTMVDISNVISLNIYASAVGPDALNAGITDQNTAGGLITARLGLSGLIAGAVSGDAASNAPDMLKSVTSIPASLAAVAFVLYASYIFLIVTGIFLMRTFVLVLLIVASPILLVDSVFPLLGEKAKMLRKVFFEQLVVGPVFMIMFALTLKFLTIFSESGRLGSNFSTISTGDTTIVTFFNLIMMLVMLHVMIKVTKSTAGEVGNFASNAMGTVGGFAIGAAAGGTGFLARKGIGGLAMKAKEKGWVTEDSNSFVGRRAYALTNSVANSNFDIRNTSVAGKMAGLGMGMGMGVKMGQEETSKKKAEGIAAVSARIKTKYERDEYKTVDGKEVLIGRKGDVDPEGVARRERFHQNQGGAVFLTKQQKEVTDAAFIDDSSSKDMEEYRKAGSKEDRVRFAANIKEQLEAVNKKEGNTTSPKAQALMRTIYDIEKKEKEDKKTFDTQLEKEIDRYNETSEAKKADYLARLDKDMREAIKSNIDPQTGKASMLKPQTEVTSTTPQPTPEIATTITGEALRQERIQKVADGRAKQVQNNTNDTFLELYKTDLEQAQAKQQASAARAIVFAENRNQNTPVDIDITQPHTPVDIDITKPFNVVEQFGKASFAQRRMEAAQAARNNMTVKNVAAVTPSGAGAPQNNKAVDEPVAV